MSRLLRIVLVGSLPLLLVSATPDSAQALESFGPAEFKCVAKKQKAAGRYSKSALLAWATWEKDQNAAKLDQKLARAGARLAEAFAEAEASSADQGVDCVAQTASAADLEATIAATVVDVVTAINAGLDLSLKGHARCGSKLLRASAMQSMRLLLAESHRDGVLYMSPAHLVDVVEL